jgi:hypothetical protein
MVQDLGITRHEIFWNETDDIRQIEGTSHDIPFST